MTLKERVKEQVLDGISHLPALPQVAMQLMGVVNSPYSSADDAAELIEKDPALTGMVLRMANSAFYGVPRSISSVSGAIVILGFNAVRSIVFTTSVFKSSPNGSADFPMNRFWHHSMAVAIAAKKLATLSLSPYAPDSESAFCAGILHDVGKLVLMTSATAEYKALVHHCAEKKLDIYQAEKAALGLTHADVGRLIADKWALPEALEAPLVHHHDPLYDGRMSAGSVHASIAAIADSLAHRAKCGFVEEESYEEISEEMLSVSGLLLSDTETVFAELSAELENSPDIMSLISGARR